MRWFKKKQGIYYAQVQFALNFAAGWRHAQQEVIDNPNKYSDTMIREAKRFCEEYDAALADQGGGRIVFKHLIPRRKPLILALIAALIASGYFFAKWRGLL